MNHANKRTIASFFFAVFSALASLTGCVPSSNEEWRIDCCVVKDEKSSDVERVRQIIVSSGYLKLAPGADARTLPDSDYFVSEKSQRVNVALLWDRMDMIIVKFSELGEKKLTTLGQQEVDKLNKALEKEFGKRLSKVASKWQ